MRAKQSETRKPKNIAETIGAQLVVQKEPERFFKTLLRWMLKEPKKLLLVRQAKEFLSKWLKISEVEK